MTHLLYLKKELGNRLLLALLIITSFCSCTTYTQIYESKPTSEAKYEEESYVFENDTVRITFVFWSKRGILSYSLYNKLSIPIYIDLKKSSLIKNREKFDYWMDESISHSNSGFYKLNYVYGVTTGISNSKTIRPERIVFVAPRSTIFKGYVYLAPAEGIDLKKYNEISTTLDNPSNAKKPIHAKIVEFTEGNSPIVFRNFLTISTTEKFDNENYLDCGFYVSKIYLIKHDDFIILTRRGELYNGKFKEIPFKDKVHFYVDDLK